MPSPHGSRHKGSRHIVPAPGQNGMAPPMAQARPPQRSTSRAARTQYQNGAHLAGIGAQTPPPGISGTNPFYAPQPTTTRPPSEHHSRAQPPIANRRVAAESVSSRIFAGSAPAVVGAGSPTHLPPDDSKHPQNEGAITQNEKGTDQDFSFEDYIHDPSNQAHEASTDNQVHAFGPNLADQVPRYDQDLTKFNLGQKVSYGSDAEAGSPSDVLGSSGQSTTDPEWSVSQHEATPMALDSGTLYNPPSSYLPPPGAVQSGAMVYQQVMGSQKPKQTQLSITEDLQQLHQKVNTLEGRLVDMERQLNGCSASTPR
ncbi:hypothetical protein JDV02_003121 [Purpureocillium takamizusanense]|uniref:Uncharacterized protein n=1 Tax=Purpureocillium takamizusanense TaxID=2060973 RepID=A0A9Q8QCG7_9HYPO|nr:uncharacterized protein JDV02_003121 [Purpureocillium takamizusanense]UNI16707.1 hypothetical protein JDV02_003121 [Purpureocillium takamizusanense]